MRQSLFILIIGFIAGVSYTQHDGFKEWADDSVDFVADWFNDLIDDTKDATEGSLEKKFDEMSTDLKENAKETFEDQFSELSTDLQKDGEELEKALKEK